MSKGDFVHVRVSPALKEEAEKVLAASGTTMSATVNMLLSKIVNVGGIPFSVTSDQSILGSDISMIDQACQQAIVEANAKKRAKGVPLAFYDTELKKAYLEYPDGKRVYND